MTNNRNFQKTFLKNILTTASTIAITLSASDAMAANVHATLANRTNVDLVAGVGVGTAVDLNSLKLRRNAQILKVAPAATVNSFTHIRGIDTASKTGAILEAGAQAFTLGVVVSSTKNPIPANEKLTINFTDVNDLILDGSIEGAVNARDKIKSKATGAVADAVVNDYSALGNIDFKDKDAAVKFDLQAGGPPVVEITSDIGSSDTDNVGKLQIVNGDINFKGNIGVLNALSEIIIDDTKNTTFSGGTVRAQDITIGGLGGGSATFGSAAGTNIVSTNGIKGGADATIAAQKNIIKIEGNATLDTAVLADINAIEIGAAGPATLIVKDKAINAAAAISLHDDAAKVVFTAGTALAPYEVNTTINGNNGVNGRGIVEVGAGGVAANVKFNAALGATNKLQKLVINDNAIATLAAAADFDDLAAGGPGNSGIFLGNGSELTIDNVAVGFANNSAINALGVDQGHLILKTVNTTVDVGANVRLNKVTLDNFMGGVSNALANEVKTVTLNLANDTKLILDANVVVENITSDGNAGNKLELNAAHIINFNVGDATDAPTALVPAPVNKSLNINLIAGTGPIDLTLGNAVAKTIYGNITNGTTGELTIKTGVTGMKVVGNLGDATATGTLAKVEIGNAANHTLAVQGNIYAPVEFQHAASELVLLGASNVNDTINGNAAPMGIITVGDGTALAATNVTFNGIIGGIGGAEINSFTVTDNSAATLAVNASFDTTGIRLGNDSELTINNGVALLLTNGATFKSSIDTKGRVILNNLNTPVQIGAVGNTLEKVTLNNFMAGVSTALANEVHAVTLDLTNGSSLIINNNIKALTVTKSAGAGKLVVNGAPATITFDVGGAGAPVEINFENDQILTIEAGKNLVSNITAANIGTVIFEGVTNSAALDIGTAVANENLTLVQFSDAAGGGGVIADVRNIYATNITVDDTVSVTAEKFGGNLNLAAANSVFTLKDNGTAGSIKGLGTFKTAGTAAIGDVGLAGPGNSIALLDMQGDATKTVTANTAHIYATGHL